MLFRLFRRSFFPKVNCFAKMVFLAEYLKQIYADYLKKQGPEFFRGCYIFGLAMICGHELHEFTRIDLSMIT